MDGTGRAGRRMRGIKAISNEFELFRMLYSLVKFSSLFNSLSESCGGRCSSAGGAHKKCAFHLTGPATRFARAIGTVDHGGSPGKALPGRTLARRSSPTHSPHAAPNRVRNRRVKTGGLR